MALRRQRRTRNERGASAVEFALIAPILVIFIIGVVELTLLMKDDITMTSAVRIGARTAAAAADAGPGTCQATGPAPPPCTPQRAPAFAQAAADAIQKTGTAMPRDDIDWLMIYSAGTNGFPLGRSNLDSCGNDCVIYRWDTGLGKFRFQSGSWDSKSVNACINDAGRHTVGVAMQVSHRWIMGFRDSPRQMRERTIMQFEPLESSRCKPGTPDAHP